jgi:hypothetical protein
MYGQLNELSAIWCVFAGYRRVNYLTTVGYALLERDGNYTTLEISTYVYIDNNIFSLNISQ